MIAVLVAQSTVCIRIEALLLLVSGWSAVHTTQKQLRGFQRLPFEWFVLDREREREPLTMNVLHLCDPIVGTQYSLSNCQF